MTRTAFPEGVRERRPAAATSVRRPNGRPAVDEARPPLGRPLAVADAPDEPARGGGVVHERDEGRGEGVAPLARPGGEERLLLVAEEERGEAPDEVRGDEGVEEDVGPRRLERPAVERQEDPVGGVPGEARDRQLLGARGRADDAGREAPAGRAADDRRDERREAAPPRRVAPRRRREPLRPLPERDRRLADRDRPASGGGERLPEAGQERPGEVGVRRRRVRERPPLGGLSGGRRRRAAPRAAPGPSGGAGGLRRGECGPLGAGGGEGGASRLEEPEGEPPLVRLEERRPLLVLRQLEERRRAARRARRPRRRPPRRRAPARRARRRRTCVIDVPSSR